MLVELNIDWTYSTTPSTPFPVTIYWRFVGATAYNTVNLSDGSLGTATITVISNSTDYAGNIDCDLQIEGYVIPNCFLGTPSDCDPDISGCTDSERVYFTTASTDATDYIECRGITAECTSGGVIGLNIDPVTLSVETYPPTPTLTISGGDGTGFTATLTYDSGTEKITGFTITNPGSGYTTPPTVTVSPSDDSVELELDVVIGCDEFGFPSCVSDDGLFSLNVGETVTLCTHSENLPFTPDSPPAFGVYDFTETGCCTGTLGSTRYRLTFNSPDRLVYPSIKVRYTPSGVNTQSTSITLNSGTSVDICSVTGGVSVGNAAGLSISQEELNWLFSEYLTISTLSSPC